MRVGAVIETAIDLVETINKSWEEDIRFPADAMLSRYYKQRRYIGSKDRGAISKLVYYILRNGAALEYWLDDAKHTYSGRALVILALVFDHEATAREFSQWLTDDKYSAAPLNDAETKLVQTYQSMPLIHGDMPEHVRLNYPEWMSEKLHAAFGERIYAEIGAMNEEAEVHLRVNTLKTTRDELMEILKEEGFEPIASPLSDKAIILLKRGPVFATEAFRKGLFEMQDIGSQLLADMVGAKAGDKVVDFCAGAGGKTLAIAANMQNKGRILAWDVSEKRLGQMPKRLARAGVNNTQIRVLESEKDKFTKRHKGTADWVLVDAPCTGSGTWKRNPDLKWRTTLKDVEEITEIQRNILRNVAALPKDGGKLVYATCSVFAEENEKQVELFLQENPSYSLIPHGVGALQENDGLYAKFSPYLHGTDGFFAAILERKG